MIIGELHLPSVACPFHGTAQPSRRPRDQRVLRIAAIARAVIAADVARHDTDRALRHAERGGHVAPDPPRASRAGVERVTAARVIPRAHRRARLHRHAGHAIDSRLEPDHVGGAREGRVGRRRVTGDGVDAHVRRGLVPDPRRVRSGGLERSGDRGQGFVRHLHPLGGVARDRRRFGDHHGHGLAHEARPVGRQRWMRRDEERGAVAAPQRDFVRIRRNRPVRNRMEAIALGVVSSEHGDHTRGRERTGAVDRFDASMSVRRPHERGVRLTGQVDVVAVAPGSGDEAPVFLAQHRLSEALTCRVRAGAEEGHGRSMKEGAAGRPLPFGRSPTWAGRPCAGTASAS